MKRIQTTIDEYIYTNDDDVIDGREELEEGKVYKESDFNRIIEIEAREKMRVKLMLDSINHNEKTLVFCANQNHAAKIRNYINQAVPNPPIDYCVRVTADDGQEGETYLRQFQDNEKNIPTILTTSQKLSTGVDALNIRNIVLMRPINTMIEFKQIIGRGTRLFEGKSFFTIVDFVNAYHHFVDPDWDGEPVEPEGGGGGTTGTPPEPLDQMEEEGGDGPKKKKIKIKLSDNKEREIQSMSQTMFYYEGQAVSATEFIEKLFKTLNLPDFFKDEEELRKIWSSPVTRAELLKKLEGNGFSVADIKSLQELINAENSDLFDVLEYIAYAKQPISREDRAIKAEDHVYEGLNDKQRDFIEFVLGKYIEGGVEELDIKRLPDHINLKYKSLHDGEKELGNPEIINKTFVDFQKHLYLE